MLRNLYSFGMEFYTMANKISEDRISDLSLSDMQTFTTPTNRSVMNWAKFDGIPSGNFGIQNLGFKVYLEGMKADYSVAIPPSVKKIHGNDIRMKKGDDPATGRKYILVYSKTVWDSCN